MVSLTIYFLVTLFLPIMVFDIQESVGLFCATVKIPAFTKGKVQLSSIDVEQTRRIANVILKEL